VLASMNYAQLVDGKVVNVIVADADFIATQTDKTYVLCQRGGIGWSFDGTNFIAPQPYPSWILDSNFDWQPPTPKPDGDYYWNEKTISWVSF
jgi:hypothetical protein